MKSVAFGARKGLLSSIRETQIIGTVNSQSTILTEEGNGRAESRKELTKTKVLKDRGRVTITHLSLELLDSSQLSTQGVHEWAESVWDAYQEQHQLARDWVQLALKSRKRK